MLNNIKIYTLSNPITNEIRYVGKTVQNLNSRLSTHIYQSANSTKKDHCHCWIKSLLNKNLKPKIELLDTTDTLNDEIFYINYLNYLGCNLTNIIKSTQHDNLGYKLNVSKQGRLNNILSKRRNNYYIYDRYSLKELGRYKTLRKCISKFKVKSSKLKDGINITKNLLIADQPDNINLEKYRKLYFYIYTSDGKVVMRLKTTHDCYKFLNIHKVAFWSALKNGSVVNNKFKITNNVNNISEFNINKNNKEYIYNNLKFNSQKELAKYLNISPSYLSQILNNQFEYDLSKFFDRLC